MTKFKELRESRRGVRHWSLTAIEYVGTRRNLYRFKCDCGNETVAAWYRVEIGDVKSCGCWRRGRPVSDDPHVPHRAVAHRYKASARHRGLSWNLTDEEVYSIIQKDCEYCGSPPSTDMKLNAHPDFRYTGIDRVYNHIGYILPNVVPCCAICNRAKLDMRFEDWQAWLARIKGHQDIEETNRT